LLKSNWQLTLDDLEIIAIFAEVRKILKPIA